MKRTINRAEEKYNMIEDIIAWGYKKYQREELERMTMPELFEVHNSAYYELQRKAEMIRC